MKIIFKTLSIAGALFVMSLTAAAQNPAVSTKYSDEQIEKQIQSYYTANARDVFPDETLSLQLRKDFPTAYDIEWETAAGIYEAEFEIDRKDYKACYDADGNLLMYVFDIRLSEIPEIIRNTAKAKYPKFKFDRDAKKTIKGKNTFYEVTLEKGETEIEATFRSDGSFVKERYD
ncbi:MAG: hypothetical protein LBQ28_08935 [Prevotellaceae bacterium]|jgi:hypothetical protein|nr:hypothetical protein [Prevotellaceae bacterium]